MMGETASFSVLIVDDDISDLNALHLILKCSYTIYFAKSGKMALKRAKENKPDIILLDIIMPDMDGFEVLTALKKSDDTRHIPVIFITGLNKAEDEEKGLVLGAVDYITKPFHASIVRARIGLHLETAKRLYEKEAGTFIVLKTRQKVRRIYFRDLMYMGVTGHWLGFHLACGETAAVYASLKDYEDALLADLRFEHCHKSFIVNMDFISVVEVHDIVLKNQERLPISKGYAGFRKRYAEWLNG